MTLVLVSVCRRHHTKICRTCRKLQDLLKLPLPWQKKAKVCSHSLTQVSSQLAFLIYLRKQIRSKFVNVKKLWTASLAHPTCTPIQNLKGNAKLSLPVESGFHLVRICIILFKYTHSSLIWYYPVTNPNFTLKYLIRNSSERLIYWATPIIIHKILVLYFGAKVEVFHSGKRIWNIARQLPVILWRKRFESSLLALETHGMTWNSKNRSKCCLRGISTTVQEDYDPRSPAQPRCEQQHTMQHSYSC